MTSRSWNPPSIELAALLPGLSSSGLTLRPWTIDDVDLHFDPVNASRAEIGRWLGWCHRTYTRTDTESFLLGRAAAWSAGTEFAFAILDESDASVLGGCGINDINRPNHFANLGYWVRTDATGRGVASTATRILARFGFLHLALDRIEIVAAAGNAASQRVAEKAGARCEGLLRNRLRIQDTPHDAVMFSLVPADVGL